MDNKGFGWNLHTLGLLGTVIMSSVAAWGTWKQHRAILAKPEEKAKSVSFLTFAYFLGVYGTQFFWAKQQGWDFALTFNSVTRCITYFLVVKATWKVRALSITEKLLLAGVAISIVGSGISSRPDLWFLVLTLVSIIVTMDMPWQILKTKSSGVVSIKLLMTFFISCSFWILYGFAADLWILKIVSPSLFVIITATIILWWIYRDKKKDTGIP